jgi:hypothetical protein
MALRAGHAFSKAFRSAAGLLALTLLASAELINFGPTPVKLVCTEYLQSAYSLDSYG